MKVYFTASARGKREFEDNYREIYTAIERLGHKNVDDLVIKIDADDLYSGTHDDQVKLYKQAIAHIQESDVVVLEISLHSLSMGYVLHKALDIGKPVVVLYARDHEPYFVHGIENEKLQVIEYSPDSIEETLKSSFDYAEDQMDTRFNFFISPSIGAYLDWVSRKKKIPRAVYLRKLIMDDIKREKSYEE